MKKSKVYTRTGDEGLTSLNGGTRISKTDIRVEAYGTVDELNAHIGVLISDVEDFTICTFLEMVQCRLFSIGACLATECLSYKENKSALPVTEEDVLLMEEMIDSMEDGLPGWRGFVLPGGSRGAALCHVCRTVCRRAERRILALAQTVEIPSEVCAYINRLSDYFFVLSRRILFIEGRDEILWKKC